jgi:hypothetical protein
MSNDPTFGEMYERLRAMSDAQQLTVYCALCPDFEVSGPSSEARAQAIAHRNKKHPELATKARIVKKRRSFSSAMTAEREAQIEEERRQRMRALGIGG